MYDCHVPLCWFVFLIRSLTLIADDVLAFGGILFGYNTGTIAMKNWLETFGKYDDELGWFLPIKDNLSLYLFFLLGLSLERSSHTPMATFLDENGLTNASVVAGIGVGTISCLVPMYQSECAPKAIRGIIVGLYQFAITIGAFLASVCLNATKDRQNHSSWQIPIAIQLSGLSFSAICLPESLRYLLFKGRETAARVALGRLLTKDADSTEVHEEYNNISTALRIESEGSSGSYLFCFKDNETRFGFRTWTGILIQAWRQLTDINFICAFPLILLYILVDLIVPQPTTVPPSFQSAGISNPFTITIITCVVNSVMAIVGLPFIDRLGRRSLLLWGAVGMCVCEFIVAIVGVTAGDIQPGGTVDLAAQRVLIASVCMHVIDFFPSSFQA
ncbi:hypothetical protein CVT24_000391 [Panaeolus cyanescens]|uniref:Major facilitator superfamily (MFS) profile domain-containing protein n=1 Tax=Panaeolus cyanescens TaxID=181874 RepID=A0A409YDJ2_9AGAR|nr:hypothetical protein CVT24_000391 [Panaeolus cyanescens]